MLQLIVGDTLLCGCLVHQVLQEKVVTLERQLGVTSATADQLRDALNKEQMAAVSAAAAAESAQKALQSRLEAKESDLQRAKLQMASAQKEYQHSIARLRREADAGAAEVARLRGAAAAAGSGAAAAGSLLAAAGGHSDPTTAAAGVPAGSAAAVAAAAAAAGGGGGASSSSGLAASTSGQDDVGRWGPQECIQQELAALKQ